MKTSNSYQCKLCPHHCCIRGEKPGRCGVRYQQDGELRLPYYGILSAVSMDPIEKKPLYHFFPGTESFSIGFFGCNLSCPFCQNASISQAPFHPSSEKQISPEAVVDLALEQKSFSVSFTYSEPLIHYEYILQAAALLQEKGIYTVLVSNAYLEHDPFARLIRHIDAVNIDLKSFSNSFYTNELGASLEPVCRNIRTAVEEGVHTEISTLIIPGKNDSEKELREAGSFLQETSPSLVWHINAYHPAYRYTLPPTSTTDIARCIDIAKEYLSYVYPGNCSLPADTHCPRCGECVVRRSAYSVYHKLDDSGCCRSCGTKILDYFSKSR